MSKNCPLNAKTEMAHTLIIGDKISDKLSIVPGGKGAPTKESETLSPSGEIDAVAYSVKDPLIKTVDGSETLVAPLRGSHGDAPAICNNPEIKDGPATGIGSPR